MAGKIIETIVGMIIIFIIYTFLRMLFSLVFSFSSTRYIWYLIVIVICIYSIPYIFKMYKIKRGSVKWSKTIGNVESSNIENTNTTNNIYEAKILYKYVVNGKEYMGNIITPDYCGSGGVNKARNIAYDYAEGKQVTIYYNPIKPEEALLIPGASPLFLLTILIPISLIFAFIYIMIICPEML